MKTISKIGVAVVAMLANLGLGVAQSNASVPNVCNDVHVISNDGECTIAADRSLDFSSNAFLLTSKDVFRLPDEVQACDVESAVLQEDAEQSEDYRKVQVAFYVGVGIIPTPDIEGASSSSFTSSFTVGANYRFTKSFYAGVRIGYCMANSSMSYHDYGESTTMYNIGHFLQIPLETGYEFNVYKDKFSIIPYGGFDFNFLLKSKAEIDGESMDVDPDSAVGVNFRLGARLDFSDFHLGCA